MDAAIHTDRHKHLISAGLAALAVLCVAMALLILYFYPRQQSLSLNPSRYVGIYHGLGWHNGPGIAGKNWTQVRVDEGEHGWWEVDLNGYGYASYRGYYPNGALMEEGVCLVTENGGRGTGDPAPDRHQVLDGKYYDPDGNLVSKVEAGTGRQILHYADGTKSWELELRDEKRVEVIWYWPSGHINVQHQSDSEERPKGLVISNYEDGTPRRRGRYEAGEHVGRWYEFHRDGSVKEIEDHSTTPSTEIAFAPGERYLDAAELAELERLDSAAGKQESH